MVSDKTTIADLRAQAKAHREQGKAHFERADKIEQAIALLEEGRGRVAPVVGRVHAPARTFAPGAHRRGGKPAGAISQRWRGNFAEIIRRFGMTFTTDNVIEVVREREDRVMRSSEVKRLFEGNITHGYLVQPGAGFYQATAKLIDLIGLVMKHEGPPAQTEGPHVGGVAERFIASDSKSDGVTLETAPVGSNPTTSAPTGVNPFAGINLGPPNPFNQPND